MDLIHIHDEALASLTAPRAGADARNASSAPHPANVFFLAALKPLEEAHRVSRVAAARARRRSGALRERTAALAVAERQAERETARRKAAELKLVQTVKHHDELLSHSRLMQEQSRHLVHQILSAQEEERKEISRELHDEVAQVLAGINVQLAALKKSAAINSRSLQQRISQTQRLVEQSVRAVHRYARELRPALLDDLGLIPAIRSYIRDLPGGKRLCIRFTAFAGVETLDNAGRTVLYRVAQEALTNVVRHAHASLATVFINRVAQGVRLKVHDDGRAFSVERILASNTNKQLGLLGMRERVEMVGGKFAIESAPGSGTTVSAEIPFRTGERGRD